MGMATIGGTLSAAVCWPELLVSNLKLMGTPFAVTQNCQVFSIVAPSRAPIWKERVESEETEGVFSSPLGSKVTPAV